MEADQDDPQAAIAADKRFHLAILDATNNPILRSFRGAIDTILSAMFDFTVDVFAAPRVAPDGADRVTVNVSSASAAASPATVTLTRLEVWPAVKVTVPEAAV